MGEVPPQGESKSAAPQMAIERWQFLNSVPDLDGGGTTAQAWWEAQCADTKC